MAKRTFTASDFDDFVFDSDRFLLKQDTTQGSEDAPQGNTPRFPGGVLPIEKSDQAELVGEVAHKTIQALRKPAFDPKSILPPGAVAAPHVDFSTMSPTGVFPSIKAFIDNGTISENKQPGRLRSMANSLARGFVRLGEIPANISSMVTKRLSEVKAEREALMRLTPEDLAFAVETGALPFGKEIVGAGTTPGSTSEIMDLAARNMADTAHKVSQWNMETFPTVAPTLQQWATTDGMTWTDFAQMAGEGVIENLPQMLLVMAGGMAMAGPAAGAGTSTAMMLPGRVPVAPWALSQVSKAAIGSSMVSVGMEASEIYQDIYQKTGQLRPGPAATFGFAAGAIEMPFWGMIHSKLLPKFGGEVAKRIADQMTKEQVFTYLARETLKAAAVEGGQEAIQTYLEKKAVEWVDSRFPALSPENKWEIAQATLIGFFSGGLFGFGSSLHERMQSGKSPVEAMEETLGWDVYRGMADVEDAIYAETGFVPGEPQGLPMPPERGRGPGEPGDTILAGMDGMEAQQPDMGGMEQGYPALPEPRERGRGPGESLTPIPMPSGPIPPRQPALPSPRERGRGPGESLPPIPMPSGQPALPAPRDRGRGPGEPGPTINVPPPSVPQLPTPTPPQPPRDRGRKPGAPGPTINLPGPEGVFAPGEVYVDEDGNEWTYVGPNNDQGLGAGWHDFEGEEEVSAAPRPEDVDFDNMTDEQREKFLLDMMENEGKTVRRKSKMRMGPYAVGKLVKKGLREEVDFRKTLGKDIDAMTHGSTLKDYKGKLPPARAKEVYDEMVGAFQKRYRAAVTELVDAIMDGKKTAGDRFRFALDNGIPRAWEKKFGEDVVAGIARGRMKAGGVQVSPSVDKNTTGFIRELFHDLGMDDANIIVADIDDGLEMFDGEARKTIAYLQDFLKTHPNAGAVMTPDSKNKAGRTGFYMVLRKGDKGFTLPHELGHVVYDHYKNSMPAEVRADLFRAYKQDGPKNPFEEISIENQTLYGTDITYQAVVPNFDEWIAQQFAKWVENGARQAKSRVERWFKSVYDALVKIFEKYLKINPNVKIAPHEAVSRWLDGLVERTRQLKGDKGKSPMDIEKMPVTDLRAKAKEFMLAELAAHDNVIDNNAIKRFAADLIGMKARDMTDENGYNRKFMQEIFEGAIVDIAREKIAAGKDAGQVFKDLLELYRRQPVLGARTGTSIINQAYSTPAPLAWLVGDAIGMSDQAKATILEPTAGTGMLLLAARPDAKATLNEIEALRRKILEDMKLGKVTDKNAVDGFEGQGPFDFIVTNPPFGLADNKQIFQMIGQDGTTVYESGMIDHVIAANALKVMKPDGRAALIVGAERDGGISGDKKRFMRFIYQNFNVAGHLEADGKLYSRQGAAWPVHVILIDGKRSTTDANITPPEKVDRVSSWGDIQERIAKFKEGMGNGTRVRDGQDTGDGDTAGGSTGDIQQEGSVGDDPVDSERGGGLSDGSGRTGPSQLPEPGGSATSDGDVGPGVVPEAGDARGTGGKTGAEIGGGGRDNPRGSGSGAETRQPSDDVVSDLQGLLDDLENLLKKPFTTSRRGAVDPAVAKQAMAIASKLISKVVGAGKTTFREAVQFLNENTKKFSSLANVWEYIQNAWDIAAKYSKKLTARGVLTIQAILKELEENLQKRAEDPMNPFQKAYIPRSRNGDSESLIPTSLKRPTEEGLDKVADAHGGDMDAFVAEQLGVPSIGDFVDPEGNPALSPEQVDALGAFFHAAAKNLGIIVADQTGVGKGRVGATAIFWAAKNGRVPISVTEKAALFNDLYRDLVAIGAGHLRPLIINSDGYMMNNDGEVIYESPDARRLKQILNDPNPGKNWFGKDKPYDFIVLTYSQLGAQSGQPKADFLSNFGGNAVVIADEAHNASTEDSQTGQRLRQVLSPDNVASVMYLSATWAKRVDNLGIYFRTDLGTAGSNQLIQTALDRGGMVLQEMISVNLAKAGQLLRREQSYDYIKTTFDKTDPVKNKAEFEEQERFSDQVSDGMRRIFEFALDLKDYLLTTKMPIPGTTQQQDVVSVGGRMVPLTGVDNPFSILHNYVSQMLLAMKSEILADKAIELLKSGVKPVIAMQNTLESHLKRFVENNGLVEGDKVDASFQDLIKAMLENTMQVRTVNPNQRAKSSTVTIALKKEDLTQAGQRHYQQVLDYLDTLDMSAYPFSPMDFLANKIREAGFTMGEITGRQYFLDYGKLKDGKPTLGKRSLSEKKHRSQTVKGFNNGKIDGIIQSAAGSTGISEHSSKTFKDQRKRTMLLGQFFSDVNTLVQTLGRINRKGGVWSEADVTSPQADGVPAVYGKPEYIFIQTGMVMENRPANSAKRKLASLNANTTGAREGATNVEAVDINNKYGQIVVRRWVQNNIAIARELDLIDHTGAIKNPDSLVEQTTGRMPLMPQSIQREFDDYVNNEYHALVTHLSEIGKNDLEIPSTDYKAKTIQTGEVMQAVGEGAFNSPITLEHNEIVIEGTPTPIDGIPDAMVPWDAAKQGAQIAQLESKWNDWIQSRRDIDKQRAGEGKGPIYGPNFENRAQRIKDNVLRGIRRFSGMIAGTNPAPSFGYLSLFDEEGQGMVEFSQIPAVPVEIRFPDPAKVKAGENPLIPSGIRIVFAMCHPKGKMVLSLDQVGGLSQANFDTDRYAKADYVGRFDAATRTVTRRYFMIGNPIMAASYFPGDMKFVKFSRENGQWDYGWRLPEGFVPSEIERPRVPLETIKAIRDALAQKKPIFSSRGWLTLKAMQARANSDVAIGATKGRNSGGNYWRDSVITSLVKNSSPDWTEQKGWNFGQGRNTSAMVALVRDDAQLDQILQRILEIARTVNDNLVVDADNTGVTMQDPANANPPQTFPFKQRKEAPLYSVEYLAAKWAAKGLRAAWDWAKGAVSRIKSFVQFSREAVNKFGQKVKGNLAELWVDAKKAARPTGLNARRGARLSISGMFGSVFGKAERAIGPAWHMDYLLRNHKTVYDYIQKMYDDMGTFTTTNLDKIDQAIENLSEDDYEAVVDILEGKKVASPSDQVTKAANILRDMFMEIHVKLKEVAPGVGKIKKYWPHYRPQDVGVDLPPEDIEDIYRALDGKAPPSKTITRDTTFRSTLRRDPDSGMEYSLDIPEVARSYVRGAAKRIFLGPVADYVHRSEIEQQIQNLWNDVRQLEKNPDPRAQKRMKDLKDEIKVLRTKARRYAGAKIIPDIERMEPWRRDLMHASIMLDHGSYAGFEQTLFDTRREANIGRKTADFISTVWARALFLFNASSALTNLSQQAFVVGDHGFLPAAKGLAKVMLGMEGWDAPFRNGAIRNDSMFTHYAETTKTKSGTMTVKESSVQEYLKYLWSDWIKNPMRGTERLNRLVAYHAGVAALEADHAAKGLPEPTEKQKYRAGRDSVSSSQFDFSGGNKPYLAKTILSPLFFLANYPLSMVEKTLGMIEKHGPQRAMKFAFRAGIPLVLVYAIGRALGYDLERKVNPIDNPWLWPLPQLVGGIGNRIADLVAWMSDSGKVKKALEPAKARMKLMTDDGGNRSFVGGTIKDVVDLGGEAYDYAAGTTKKGDAGKRAKRAAGSLLSKHVPAGLAIKKAWNAASDVRAGKMTKIDAVLAQLGIRRSDVADQAALDRVKKMFKNDDAPKAGKPMSVDRARIEAVKRILGRK